MVTLQAVAILGLLPHDVENGIDKLGAFGVVTLGPVVSGAGLSEDEVIRSENLSVRSRSEAVHSPRLQIHENGPRDESSTTGLVVVDVDSLQLEFGVSMVSSGGVDPVLGADDLPELGADLVAALAALDVKDFAHFFFSFSSGFFSGKWREFGWEMRRLEMFEERRGLFITREVTVSVSRLMGC